MSYIRRHICGPHSVASIVGQGLWVNGVVHPITDAISPRISASGRVAYKTHETGAAMVLEPDGLLWLAAPTTAGHAPLAWWGEDVLIQVDNSGVLRRVTPAGVVGAYPVGRYASEGIARVQPDGTVWFGHERAFRADVHGLERLWSWDGNAAGDLVGLSEAGHPSRGCVARWRASEARWLMWIPSAHVQEAPSIAEDGRVAISGLDTPEPDAVPWVPLAWPAPPPLPPRPAFPAPPETMPACWIGGVGRTDGYVPGNCAWGKQLPSDTRPVTEMSAWASDIVGRTLLCGLWLSDNHADPATVEAEIAFAQSRGAHAVYLHEDDATQRGNVLAAAARVLSAGLEPIKGSHVNQGEAMHWPDGVTLNVRTAGKNLSRLRDGVVGVIESIRAALFPPRVVLIFGWHDGGPLEDRYPELAAYLSAVIAKVGTPTARPGQPSPPPAPRPWPAAVSRPAPSTSRTTPRRRWWQFWK